MMGFRRNERGSAVLPLVLGAMITLTALMAVLQQKQMQCVRVVSGLETTLDIQTFLNGYMTAVIRNRDPGQLFVETIRTAPEAVLPGISIRPVLWEEWPGGDGGFLDIEVIGTERPGAAARVWRGRIAIACGPEQCRVISIEKLRTEPSVP